MNSPGPMPFFDGHNDALLRLWKRERPGRAARLSRRRRQGTARSADGGPGRIRRRACSRSSCPRRKNQVTTADNAAPVSGTAPGAPVPPPLDLATAQAAVLEHGVDPVPHRARGERTGPHLPHGRRHPPLHRHRRAGRGAAYRGRRGDRSGVRDARRAASGGAALARPGVEPAECVRSRRAVPLSVVARHRARPDRSRQGADPRLQPAEHPDRPVASQREAASGTWPNSATRRWSPRIPTPMRSARIRATSPTSSLAAIRETERHGRREFRGELPARGRPPGQRHAGRARSSIMSST